MTNNVHQQSYCWLKMRRKQLPLKDADRNESKGKGDATSSVHQVHRCKCHVPCATHVCFFHDDHHWRGCWSCQSTDCVFDNSIIQSNFFRFFTYFRFINPILSSERKRTNSAVQLLVIDHITIHVNCRLSEQNNFFHRWESTWRSFFLIFFMTFCLRNM